MYINTMQDFSEIKYPSFDLILDALVYSTSLHTDEM